MRKIECSLFIEGTVKGDVKRGSYKKERLIFLYVAKIFRAFLLTLYIQ